MGGNNTTTPVYLGVKKGQHGIRDTYDLYEDVTTDLNTAIHLALQQLITLMAQSLSILGPKFVEKSFPSIYAIEQEQLKDHPELFDEFMPKQLYDNFKSNGAWDLKRHIMIFLNVSNSPQSGYSHFFYYAGTPNGTKYNLGNGRLTGLLEYDDSGNVNYGVIMKTLLYGSPVWEQYGVAWILSEGYALLSNSHVDDKKDQDVIKWALDNYPFPSIPTLTGS